MFNSKKTSPYQSVGINIVAIFILFYTMSIGKDFIIPIIIALLFSFAILGLSNFYKKFKINSFFSITLALITYAVIFWILGKILNNDFKELIEELPNYQSKMGKFITQIFDISGIPKPKSLNQVIDTVKNFDISGLFTSTISAVTGIFSRTGIIFFYTLFILLESRYVGQKLILAVRDEEKRKNIQETMEKIKTDTKAYFIIKSIISLITAILSYSIMLIFGLKFAVFWSFLIFILNFIPNVGSIVALSFPIILSLVQYSNTLFPFIIISSGLIGIQIFMGNIVEPKFMGNRLNLSPLVIILSLSFWGNIWGIVGMILSVPIMIIINIILGKFPPTRPLAIILSEQGKLNINSVKQQGKGIYKYHKKIIKTKLKQ